MKFRGFLCIKVSLKALFYQALILDWVLFFNILGFFSALGAFTIWKRDDHKFESCWIFAYGIFKLVFSFLMAIAMGLLLIPSSITLKEMIDEGPCEKVFPNRIPPENCNFTEPMYTYTKDCRKFSNLCLFTEGEAKATIIICAVLCFYFIVNFVTALQFLLALRKRRASELQQPPTMPIVPRRSAIATDNRNKEDMVVNVEKSHFNNNEYKPFEDVSLRTIENRNETAYEYKE